MVAVLETVVHKTRVLSGKEYHVTITRRKGLDTYTERTEKNGQIVEEQILARRGYIYRLGTQAWHHAELYAVQGVYRGGACRRPPHIQEVAAKILIDQGIW